MRKSDILCGKGDKAFGKRDYKAAEKFYKKAVAEDIMFGQAWYMLSVTQTKLKNFPEALESINSALSFNLKKETYLIAKAKIYGLMEKYTESVNIAELILKSNPNNLEALQVMKMGQEKLGRTDFNNVSIKEILLKDLYDTRSWCLYAAEMDKSENIDKFLKYCEEIKVKDPYNYNPYIFLFDKYLYSKDPDYDKCFNYLKRILALKSVSTPAIDELFEERAIKLLAVLYSVGIFNKSLDMVHYILDSRFSIKDTKMYACFCQILYANGLISEINVQQTIDYMNSYKPNTVNLIAIGAEVTKEALANEKQ